MRNSSCSTSGPATHTGPTRATVCSIPNRYNPQTATATSERTVHKASIRSPDSRRTTRGRREKVPGARLELACPFGRRPLKTVCLPVPPSGQDTEELRNLVLGPLKIGMNCTNFNSLGRNSVRPNSGLPGHHFERFLFTAPSNCALTKFRERGWNRTIDPLLKRQMLYL